MNKTTLIKQIVIITIGMLLLVMTGILEFCSRGMIQFTDGDAGNRIKTEQNKVMEGVSENRQMHRVADGERIGCLNLWPAAGGASAGPMTVYYDSQDAGIQAPQIIYVRDEQATSVFCTRYGAALSSGNIIEVCSEEAYQSLNHEQKTAISQVLGSAAMPGAPRDEAQGYIKLNTGDCTFDNFQLYVSAQLMLWYYIDLYSDAPGSGNTGGITWSGVERTCNAGWGNLEECWRIWECVSTNKIRPDFAGETAESAPVLELIYNPERDCYERLITDSKNCLAKFQIMDAAGMECIRCNADGTENKEGNSLLLRSETPISEQEAGLVSLQRRVNGSTVYYIKNLTESQDMVLRGGGMDLLVDAYVKIYTEQLPVILIEKRDTDTGELLSGVHLQLLEGDRVIADWLTSGEICMSRRLQAGHTYRIHEVQEVNGYLPVQDIFFTAEASESPQVITMYNKKTTVEICKVDAATGAELPGARLELYQGDELLESWVSKETPHVIRGLQKGIRYRLKESLAPLGYQKSSDMEFTVTGEEGQRVVVKNEAIRGSLLIKKTDAETGAGLSGAVIELYHMQGTEKCSSGTYKSDAEGRIQIDNLEYGEYYVMETKAPNGYIRSDSILSFIVDGSKELIELEIKNEKEPVTTEETTTEYVTTEETETEEPVSTEGEAEQPEGTEEPSTLVLGASMQKPTPKTEDTSIPLLVFLALLASGMIYIRAGRKK